ncbi:J domain-containing protein [Halocatena pleomorpha]|uniref:J domain-containing protein n=1 Tax=Halocatena pleomorpha TaxID=1785090 RepID=A0A3P3R9C7_9EURY|nr:DnaJ domain-containing protein [Halocatena pleomorpha]RRJ30072.1 hypothetical protein EIK79_10835 [Halocatena pleomorpha]
MPKTHYEILDISPDATEDEIKRAYRQKIHEHQPGGNDDEPDAHERVLRIRAAKETLLDPRARRRYDRVHDIQTGSEEPSDETASHDDSNMINLITGGVAQLRTVPGEGKRWVATHRPHTITLDVVYSPTAVRLAITVVLSLAVTEAIRAINTVTAATELGVVLVSLCTCYVGYGVLSPLPFEEPRSREQFTRTSITIWPVLVFYSGGLGLLWTSILIDPSSSGIEYAVMTLLYVPIVCIGCLIVGIPGGILLGRAMPLWTTKPFQELQSGIALGVLGSGIVLFTTVGQDGTLSSFVETVGSNQGTPWLPMLRVGPLHLGSVLNFGLAVGLFLSLTVGVAGALWALTTVPWRDRYEHGYRVRPTVWNLLVVVPLVIVMWMWIRSVTVLSIPIGLITIELSRSVIGGGLLVALPLFVSAYLLRRRLERLLDHE